MSFLTWKEPYVVFSNGDDYKGTAIIKQVFMGLLVCSWRSVSMYNNLASCPNTEKHAEELFKWLHHVTIETVYILCVWLVIPESLLPLFRMGNTCAYKLR